MRGKQWSRQLGRVVFDAPCKSVPKGILPFILIVRSGELFPEKKCPGCQLMTILPGFLKHVSQPDKEGYAWWMDGTRCFECDPPEPIALHFDKHDKLRMKVEMHWADGSLYETWDDAEQRLRPPSEIGLRFDKKKMELRLQPYTKKSGPDAHRMGEHTGGQGTPEEKEFDVNKFGEKQVRLF